MVGIDPEFNYDKLIKAVSIIERNKEFIACNREKTYPISSYETRPGCDYIISSIISAISASGKEPIVIGKPNEFALRLICIQNNILSQDILVIGDSYENDILMAKKAGCFSILISNTPSIESLVEAYESN